MTYLLIFLTFPFLLFSPLRIDILFLRKDNRDKIFVTLKPLWGALKIPVNVEEAREEVDPDVVRTVKKVDPRIYWHLASLLPRMRGRVAVKALTLRVDFSLGDAAVTGMAAGLLWSAAGGLLVLVRDFFKLQQTPRVAINPLFNQEQFFNLHARGSLEVSPLTLFRMLGAMAVQLLKELSRKLARFWQQKTVKTSIKEG